MTEQEAKIVAAELEHHRDWQVSYVGPIIGSLLWGIWLQHRRHAQWIALLDARPDHIRHMLAGEIPSDVTYSIDFKPSSGPK